MSSVVQKKTKLLIVDTVPSMARVLKIYAEQNGYESDVFSDSAEACVALANRFMQRNGDYDCVVLGWPGRQLRLISDLLEALASPDHCDLPLIVLSETPDKDVQTVVRRRAKTRSLLWRDHKKIESVVESIAIREEVVAMAPPLKQRTSDKALSTQHILLVDDTNAICNALKELLEANSYNVVIVNTVREASEAVAKRPFDLVLTEYFLREDSAENFCQFLKSLPEESRPVYAVMTSKNLDSVVQRSLELGAITCLDKTESTDILCARLDAITKGIARKVATATVESNAVNSSSDVPVQRTAASLLQKSKAPALLIDSKRTIVAFNDEAATLLAAGSHAALLNKNFEKAIHGAPVKRSPATPVKALFRSVAGESFPVVYRSCDINGLQIGLTGELCMLTFEMVDETNDHAGGTKNDSNVKRQSALPAVNPASAVARVPVSPESEAESLRDSIDKALMSGSKASVTSLLMLDIKMVAAVTGDRLSLGKSEPLLEMVRVELDKHYPVQNSLSYIGEGKFVFIFESVNLKQARALAEKMVSRIPDLIAQLSDVALVSHAAFVELPRHSDLSARIILQHCSAACLRTEIDELDNAIFDIDIGHKVYDSRSVLGAADSSGSERQKPIRPQKVPNFQVAEV